jgi:dihydrofolate reductase
MPPGSSRQPPHRASERHAHRGRGLISRYIIALAPVVLGAGIPLFATAARHESLRLTEVKPYPSSMVVLTYEARP